MNVYPLIFSNNRNYRIARHSIFWFMWIAYYTIFGAINLSSNFPLSNRFFSCLLEVTLSTPMDMIFCYSIIYFLLPHFLFRGRYISMVLLWLLFSVIFIVVFEIYSRQLVPSIRGWFGLAKPKFSSSYYWIFFNLFSLINMEGCLAAAIKLGKLAFIKQKEIDLLKNEKANLQALTDKIEMQPAFLVDIIDRIERIAIEKPMIISDLMKKIRHLMIHVLYENTKAKVNLKKELELIKEYIELEQNTARNFINVNLSVSGNMESENIASSILLQFVQNAFKQLSTLDVSNKTINIKVSVTSSILDVVISWYKPLYTSTLAEGKNIILQNLSKRLKLIYPQSHEMKFFIQVDEIIQSLKIDLKKAIN